MILTYSWIYLPQSTSSTLTSGMLFDNPFCFICIHVFVCMLIWDLTLNIDLCYSYFTYISMEKFVKTLEASAVVSGALVCPFFIDNKFLLSFMCISDVVFAFCS